MRRSYVLDTLPPMLKKTGRLHRRSTLAGELCNAYGNDVVDLVLSVKYQTPESLNVWIFPRYLAP